MKSNKNELPTVVGFMIIFVAVMARLPQSEYDLESINWFTWVVLFVLLLVNCKWVSNIAKRQKRNSRFWSLFAFFAPVPALIIIGLLDEKSPPAQVRPTTKLVKEKIKLGNLYLEDEN
ncbi:MAG: hypothetical protein HY064_13950 [Bacteroidetes bacterium]|nr:hypothetical protein [Bacteroidota bacterium]